MRKVFVLMALAVLALGSQAQVLKNDLLKGYKVGDTLEKTVYDDKRASINVDTWCGQTGRRGGKSYCRKGFILCRI